LGLAGEKQNSNPRGSCKWRTCGRADAYRPMGDKSGGVDLQSRTITELALNQPLCPLFPAQLPGNSQPYPFGIMI
jgi:hypothetical protein